MKSRLFFRCLRHRGTLSLFVVLAAKGSLSAEPNSLWTRHAIDPSDQERHLSGADGVKFGDLNGEGLVDFVTGWEEGGKVRICLNPGKEKVRQPWPAITVGRVPSPEDAVFSDLDQDGNLDVVSACEGKERRLHVHWAPSPGSPLLEEANWITDTYASPELAQWWMQILPHDMDRDGDTDLIAGSKNTAGSVTWLENPGGNEARNLNAWQIHEISSAGWIMSLTLSRFAGKECLVYSDRKGSASGIWIAPLLPKAPWLETPRRVAAAGEEVMFLDIADIDGDDSPEILAAIRPATIRVYASSADQTEPDGEWRVLHELAPLPWDRFGTVKALRWHNTPGGSPEGGVLAVTCENATEQRCGLLLATLSSEWSAIGGEEGVKFDLVDWVDLDEDGDSDLVTCEERAGLGVVWYENPGTVAGR